jgi:hypothetical protein
LSPILVLVLLTWALLLTLAAALIIHPHLGTGIRTTSGSTPTDFVSALFAGGSSLALVGASDFVPQTAAFRFFYLLTSLVGVAMVPLTVTYLMELYGSLQARNALGLSVHLLSAETGDAADVLAGLGARGRFDAGYSDLVEWAAETVRVKESHHFYPILFYFRFRETFYSISRTTLTSLDTVALIKSALDDQAYGWLKEAAAVEQLGRASLMELKTLAKNVLPKADTEARPDAQTRARWERRYAAALERLRRADIKTSEAGLDEYITLRCQWDRTITLLAPIFAFDLDEIDPALAKVK